MELHELHVLERRAGVVRERLAVARVLPAVRRDLERATDAARAEHDGLRLEDTETTALAIVGERAGDAIAVLEQREDGDLHVHVEPCVHAVILQRANQLEPRAIADVRETRIPMAAEVALKNSAVGRAIEQRAPRLELLHAIRRFLRVQLGHAPVVEILAAAHRVGEMHAPVVAIVDVPHRRGHAALGHHRVRLAEQRLAHEADLHAIARRLDRRAQPGAAGADHEHVVLDRLDSSSPRLAPRSQDPPVVPDSHRAHPHVDVGERDADETHPRPLHVPAIETARTVVRLLAHRMARELIEESADRVAQRVAAERVAAEQHDVDREHERADADAEVLHARGVVEPQRLPHVVREEERGTARAMYMK